MSRISLPGFTAEAAVSKTIGDYRGMVSPTAAMAGSALAPALPVGAEPQYVDCNKFYNSWVCRECGATGPESIKCCTGDYCAVIDKTPLLTVHPPIFTRPGRGVFAF